MWRWEEAGPETLMRQASFRRLWWWIGSGSGRRNRTQNSEEEGAILNIAIIGAGNVGSTLGTAWAKKGHRIVYGVRNPAEEKVQGVLKSSGGKASAATIAQAAAQARIVLFATPGSAAKEAIAAAGNRSGKV